MQMIILKSIRKCCLRMYNDGMAIYYSIQNFHDCIEFRHTFDVKYFHSLLRVYVIWYLHVITKVSEDTEILPFYRWSWRMFYFCSSFTFVLTVCIAVLVSRYVLLSEISFCSFCFICLRLAYPMLSVYLDYPFLIALRCFLTFIY